MLQIENLKVSYGNIEALRGVTLDVGNGEMVAVVGPNGAGKTTMFKAISGVQPQSTGRITFAGQDLMQIAPHKRAQLGIAHVPEGRQVFKTMTVMENLKMGASLLGNAQQIRQSLDRVLSYFPILSERANQFAGMLSGGQQQMLAIGRGLASSPRLLMLDEPSMGLSPLIAEQIFERIQKIHRDEKLTIILVEQRVAEALQSCDKGYVLDSGAIVAAASPLELMNDERIRKAYLGL